MKRYKEKSRGSGTANRADRFAKIVSHSLAGAGAGSGRGGRENKASTLSNMLLLVGGAAVCKPPARDGVAAVQ